MTTAIRLKLVADSLNELKLPCHEQAVHQAAAELEALQEKLRIATSDLECSQEVNSIGGTMVQDIKRERDSLRSENEQLRETLASQREAFEIGIKWQRDSRLEEWFPITAEELTSLRTTVAELQKENAELKEQCKFTYCAYCDWKTNVSDPEALRLMQEHAAQCSNHPMFKLRTTVAELQRDKERLDWGEKNFARVALGTPQLVGEKWTIFGPSDDGSDDVEGNTLREAIDAAMSAEKK